MYQLKAVVDDIDRSSPYKIAGIAPQCETNNLKLSGELIDTDT